MCMAGDTEAAEQDQELLAYLQGSTEVPVQTYYLGVSCLPACTRPERSKIICHRLMGSYSHRGTGAMHIKCTESYSIYCWRRAHLDAMLGTRRIHPHPAGLHVYLCAEHAHQGSSAQRCFTPHTPQVTTWCSGASRLRPGSALQILADSSSEGVGPQQRLVYLGASGVKPLAGLNVAFLDAPGSQVQTENPALLHEVLGYGNDPALEHHQLGLVMLQSHTSNDSGFNLNAIQVDWTRRAKSLILTD